MDDNNKLLKQAKPQEFELIELLFQEYIRSNIARPDIEYSFQARFQSFINQIPSYLHSSNKVGFFTHFFFGSFATLLDTELSKKIGINKLHYNFDQANILRVVAETDGKTHVFIFAENSSKNNQQQQNQNKDLEFTKGEWNILKDREYIDADKNDLEISVIKVNKSKGSIKVIVEKQDIKDAVDSTKQYHEVTKQCVNKNGHYVYLEDQISLLSDIDIRKMNVPLQDILRYIKKIHDYYQGLPYGDGALEADQHGLVAGIFNNFRYRENAHVYLEQFAGKGYADIVLLVRGAERSTKSIPIIIELKAGSGSGTTSSEALAQVTEYSKGFQPNNMRILTIPDNILCVGMNLDHDANSFMQMKLVQRDQEMIPLMQGIIDAVKKAKVNNNYVITQEIQHQLENTYQTFPGVGEKSSAHYFSRFMVGESLALQDYDKHIFVYDDKEYIVTKTVINQHATRSQGGSTAKQQKIEKVVDSSNAVTSMLFIPIRNSKDPAIIVNIIDANRDVILKNIPLDNAPIGNRKIVELNIKFNIHKSNKSFQEYCDIELLQIYNSVLEYNQIKGSEKVNGNFKVVEAEVAENMIENISDAIDSQRGLIITESKYQELFKKLEEILYPLKSLVNTEAEFQGILEGVFKYYGDIKLNERSDRRELVLTEFQTGGGGRIDMLIQAIGASEQGTKEYMPVGFELKYDDSVKLSSFDQQQDEYIQRLILGHKEKVLVNKLLNEQAERYLQGAAIKAITDSNKVAIMGIVFNARAKDSGDLLLTTDKFLTANIVHSSKLYSVSSNVNAINAQDSLKSDAEYFRPDWVEQETYDVLARARGDDDSILYLSNSALNDQTVKRLGDLLKSEVQVGQYIDGLDLSFNTVTASSVQELIKQFSKLVYLDLSDNDLGNNHIIDLEEIIKDIQVPILKIADIGMNDEQMQRVFKSLKEQDKISDLEVTHLDDTQIIMSDSTASAIAKYLQSTKSLNALNLAKNKIGDEAIRIIAEALMKQDTVSSLVLTNNGIGVEGADKLASVLKDTVISHIDLSGNVLGVSGVAAIVAGIKDIDSVKSIELVNVDLKYDRENRQESEELLSSIESLFKNTHLTKVNIAYNDIGNGGLATIFKILSAEPNKSNLQDLSLAGNKIDWGAHQATINTLKGFIYNFLSKNEKIRSLDLSWMGIDDDIGERIASALEKNVSLVNLDLGGNDGIGIKTVESVASVLKTHQYLKYVNLSDNKLAITDLEMILGSLKTNEVVSHINLSGNDFAGIITDVNGQEITDLNNQYVDFEKLLSGNRELKYLNLANCKLNKQSILSLCKAIENNIAIEVLDIRGNKIESSIIDSIVGSLNKNANQGLDIGLKILHVSKGDLEGSAISKLTDKSLGIAVLVDGIDVLHTSAEERLKQTSCTINALDKQSVGELDRDQQTFESSTISGQYHYWVQAHDISDIARVHYGYGEERPIEIVGSIGQLSTQIDQYRTNNNNSKPLTVILNIGADGVGGDHWVSLVLHNRGNEYQGYYVDSLGNNIAGNVASILSQHRIMIYDLSNQQQRDGYNCGLWALENGQRISEFLANNGEIGNDINNIRNSLARSRSEQEFEEIRDNILRELLNDNQRRMHLDNIGIAQIEIPQDYNDNYNLYTDGRQAVEQCAMLAMIGSSIKLAKSKRSIAATNDKNENKLLLDSQQFVNCAYDVKQEVVFSQLTSLVNHFKVVGDNKSCKAIDKLIINQGIINRLNSIDKTVPIEVINIKNAGYNWSALHVAAQLGNVEEAEKQIKQGIDVNVRARDGWSPLHLASQYASKEVVSLLIKSGAETNVVAKRGWTPLHLAAQSISVEVIEQLIINGVYVDGQTDNGWSPLHVAIQCANQEIVRALLKNKANINISNQEGWTAIYLAVLRNNIGMVKLLMEHKADITVMSQERNTPLHIAIKNDYKEITKYLIEEFRGDNNYTLLHLAVKSNNKALIDIIIKNGANINAVDNHGDTVLHLAIAINNIGLVKYLIAHNIDVNIHDQDGNTALHLAVAMNNEEMVQYLIEHKANVNAVDKYGNAPLHLAVVVNNKEIVEYLIEHKANVNTSNNNGDSPISVGTKVIVGTGLAAIGILLVIGGVCVVSAKGIGSVITMRGGYSALSGSDHEVLDRLVEHGASLNVQNGMGNTPLHESVQHNNYEMVEFWLNKGANIDATNNIGNTPLHIATNNLRYRGRITRDAQDQNIHDTITEKIISILVEQNAHVISQNKVHDTPLHLAVRKNNNKIVKLFLKEVKVGEVLFSIPDNDGDTIVSLAFKSNNSDMISCLTNFMDCTGNNILHLAILGNEKQVLLLLMQNKVDVNVVNQDGNTPLYLAVKSNNKEVIDILIKNGADIDDVNNNGDTSLHLAVFMKNEELVKYLIAYKANINMQDNDGNTPLHLAMNLRHQEIMKYLIQYGANVSIKNKLGEFALQDVFVLNMFKSALDNNGNSMLHNAVKDHDEKMVLLLLQEKVNIDIQNKEGNTALHVAAKEQDIKIFELLLQSRADINIKNMAGKTPIELGIKNGMEVHQLLYKYRISVFTEPKDLSHPHRHHHGENYDGKEHRENQEHTLGNHRGRRDIEDELKITKDYHDNIEVTIGNMAEISSSSASSGLKPIGYNIVSWIKGAVSKLTGINPAEQIKENVAFHLDDDEQAVLNDVDVADNAVYQDSDLEYLCAFTNNVVDNSQLLEKGYKVAQLLDRFAGNSSTTIIKEVNYDLLDKQGNLLLLDVLMRKKSGIKYKCQPEQNIVSSNNLDSEYAQSLAYRGYVAKDKLSLVSNNNMTYMVEDIEDMGLVGVN